MDIISSILFQIIFDFDKKRLILNTKKFITDYLNGPFAE